MKKFSKTIAFISCILLSISFLVACGKKELPVVPAPPPPVVEDTNKYILKDGKTDYKILYPDNSTSIESMAVSELQYFFEQATNFKLESVSDKGIKYDANSKYLVIGDVAFLSEVGVSINKDELGVSGYQIINKNESLFILGGFYGTLYGAYDFLSKMFNYECYAADEIAIDKNVKKVPLNDFKNLKVIPEIQMKTSNYGELANNTLYQRRMHNVLANEVIGVLGGMYHNFEYVVKPSEHPEWYNGGYLCMTRDVEGLSTHVANKVIDVLKINKTSIAVTFSQIDSPSAWCSGTDCGCSAAKNKYGTDAAAYIQLMNKVAEKVDAYLNEISPEREFYIILFAYNKSLNAPTKTLEDGSYVPFDDSVKMHKRLGVMYAPFYTTSFFYGLSDEKNNAARATMEKWSVCSQSIFYWSYTAHFGGGGMLDPFYSIGTLKDTIDTISKLGTKYWFDQAAYDSPGMHTDWSRLKIYLSSKLCQDNSLDINTLTDNYFNNYFKDSSESMRKFYDDMMSWFNIIKHNYPSNVTGFPEEDIRVDKYWPYKTLTKWTDYIDEARASIKKHELVDKELYNKLLGRINLESITIRRLIIKLYKSEFGSNSEYNAYIRALIKDATDLGATYGLDVASDIVS